MTRPSRLKYIAETIIEECGSEMTADVVCEYISDPLEDDFSNSMSCTESGPYRYEQDGYILEECGNGDFFVIKSPFYAFCGECSPCAPNAGYLTSDGSMKTYCLGPEWFDDEQAPYDVYNVSDDKLIYGKPTV
jgi:hypothetical protein